MGTIAESFNLEGSNADTYQALAQDRRHAKHAEKLRSSSIDQLSQASADKAKAEETQFQRDLMQAALDSLMHIGKRVDTLLHDAKTFDRIDKQRISDKGLLEHAFLRRDRSTRERRAYKAYQARQTQFNERWLEEGSLFRSATETLNSLRPAWGDLNVERLLAELVATGELEQLRRFIDDVLQRLFDQCLSAPRDSPEGAQKAAETRGSKEVVVERAERKRLLDQYKADCKEGGIKITNSHIGLAVMPNSKDPQTIVSKWLQCDPRYEPYDARIRKVFRDKAHLKDSYGRKGA